MQLFLDDIGAIKHYFGKFEAPDDGCYDWDCEICTSIPRPTKKMLGFAEFIATKDPVAILLKQIKSILDYIILFRDKWTRYRAEKLLESLLTILNTEVAAADKAQLIRNQWLDWVSWMQAVHPGQDLLRDECCSLGAELIICYLTK